jgi:hypothetical protein
MTKCAYEEAFNTDVKSSKAFREDDKKCAKCGRDMMLVDDEWKCTGNWDGCYYSFEEVTE